MEWHLEDCNYKIVVFFFCENPPQVATFLRDYFIYSSVAYPRGEEGGGGGWGVGKKGAYASIFFNDFFFFFFLNLTIFYN